ncbi:MAG: hypothetical protein HYR90_04200, partial [Candidatus Andersenbacteria bacterium]|nr:hypothetical protein [Candidatus Andersenbacteria bacterium]
KGNAAATWNEYYDAWAEAEATVDAPYTSKQADQSKNLVTITNDSKS